MPEAVANVDFVHTGPGTLAGRYLRRFWQPVAMAEHLPAGRTKPIRILGDDLTLYRGESGSAHLLAFRCAHRGTQLSTGWVEGDDLRCFYHGWKYDSSGQCIEQPAEPEPFCQKVRIQSYPTYEYLRVIFAYLGEGEPPPVPRFQLFEEEGDLRARNYIQPCNFFNQMENTTDPGHTKFVHRWPHYAEYGLTGIPSITAEEREWGLSTHITWPDWPPEEIDTHHVLMPNGMMNRIAHGDLLSWRVPIDDVSHLSFSLALARRNDQLPRVPRGGASSHGSGQPPFSVRDWGDRVLVGEAQVGPLIQEFELNTTDAFN
ncbi:MAG TPA: Rieske 2Fe-2S domain-containing protein, partial [Chloroflexota bacterium]